MGISDAIFDFRLTLKEGPKVKSDHIKRFLAHDLLLVWSDLTLGLFFKVYVGFTLKPLGPILSEL